MVGPESMSAVIFFTGSSRGDAFKAMSESYKSAFEQQGYTFIQVDQRDPQNLFNTLNHTLENYAVEFAFSFMNCGSTLVGTDENGKRTNLWQGANIPFLSLMGDSPAYYFDLHITHAANHACLYGFPEHEVFRRRLLPHLTNGFIGAFQPLLFNPVDITALDFKTKADGSLFFLKNGNDPRQLWDSWDVLPSRPRIALREMASYLRADLANPLGNQLDDIVTAYCKGAGFDLSTLLKLRLFFVAQLDDYYRRLKSTMMGEALMDFPVHIVGENWEHLDFVGKTVLHTNRCDYKESHKIIQQSLGIIDMSPNTSLAPHDRACRAAAAHTLCLTNEQEYFRNSFAHHEQFSFHFDRESFRDKVADVIARPKHYIEVGIEAAATFWAVSPPNAAIQQLIDLAGVIRFDQRRDRVLELPNYFVWPPQSLAGA